MNSILLAVVFMISGEPAILDGWHPLPMKNLEICEQRRIMLSAQLDLITEDIQDISVITYCGTAEDIQKKIDILHDIQI